MIKSRLLIFILLVILSSCFDLANRHDTLIKQSSNKSHNKKAILFLMEGGATISDSYQVSIVDYYEPFDSTQVGNTFTVDTNHGYTGLDSTSIDLTWLSYDTLLIDYDKRLRTFIKKIKVNGVSIVYEER